MNESGLADELLASARVIAVFGYSTDPTRPSNSVSRYLRSHGYRIIPVNPLLNGATIEGEQSYGQLADIPKDAGIGFVDVFRRGQFLDAGVGAIWFQLGLGNIEAAQRAERAGMRVVWDRCTAIEHRRMKRA
jgi:predicted CoA-binding protein